MAIVRRGILQGELGRGNRRRGPAARRLDAGADERRQRRGGFDAGRLVTVGQGGVVFPPVAPMFRPPQIRGGKGTQLFSAFPCVNESNHG